MQEIRVVRDVMRANKATAEQNRELFKSKNVTVFNLISSPGSGKTTLLERTAEELKSEMNLAIIVGDIATSRDAERIAKFDVSTIQINTGGTCHLPVKMVSESIMDLDLNLIDLLLIENVGNLVCPTGQDLGESHRIGVLSVTEGNDKPIKYPALFRQAACLVMNKIDLLPYIDFDKELFYDDLNKINSNLPVIEVSCTTGEGLKQWFKWVKKNVMRKV